ncbi:MAG: betaine--homocysteine S-methyltransferase [Pseudomonadota bacterium]
MEQWFDGTNWYSEKPVLVADGGIGTGLFARGLTSGDSPELWNIEQPQKILDLHLEFIKAGSDIILTNSFGANRARLKLHGLENKIGELCKQAVKLAKEAASKSKRQSRVAGSIGPTGEIVEPDGPFSQNEAKQLFNEQAQALAEAGADAIWIETMSSKSELESAILACANIGLPIFASMTFDTNAHTMMGVSPADAYAHYLKLQQQCPQIRFLGVGANCGLGPAETLAACLRMQQNNQPTLNLLAKSNCGIPEYKNGAFVFSGTRELMREYTKFAIDLGICVIGGCCGSDGNIVSAIREVVDTHTRASNMPTIEILEQKLGHIYHIKTQQNKEKTTRRSSKRRQS